MSLWYLTGRGHGDFILPVTFPPGVINKDSFVLANICEIAHIPGIPHDVPWMGAAPMQILNIVPRDNKEVVLHVSIKWDHDLDFRIQYFIF